MSFIVNLSVMQDVLLASSNVVQEWQEGYAAMREKELVLETSSQISGNAADRMKEYLDTVYSFTDGMIAQAMSLFLQKFIIYYNDYRRNIDNADNARILEEELGDRYDSLRKKRKTMQDIGGRVEDAVSKVSDLVSVSGLDISPQDEEIRKVIKSVEVLDDTINDLERKHVSEDFAELDTLLYRIESFLMEMIKLNKEYKINFSTQSFAALSSVVPVIDAMDSASVTLTAMQPEFQAAAENLQQIIERQQQEMEERQENANWLKIGVAIVTGLASAVAIATGVGTLLVPVIFGIAGGVINAIGTQYVEYSWNTENWDTGYIAKESLKGGGKGLVSGFTGAFLPDASTLVNAGISGAESAIWGGLDEVYDQMAATGNVTDVNSVLFEGAKSGTSDFVQEFVGGFIGDKVKEMPIGLGLDQYDYPTEDIRHYIGEGVRGGTKKVASGIGERIVGETVETGFDIVKNWTEGEESFHDIDLGERYSKVMSFEEIGKDFVTGSQKGIASSYSKDHTLNPKTGQTPIDQYKQDYTQSASTPREMKILQDMEKNGEFDLDGAKVGPANYASSTKKTLTDQPIDVNFSARTKNGKYDERTFAEQLGDQEEGLNFSNAADVLDNMERFQRYGRADSSDTQNNYRLGVYKTIVDERTDEQIASIMAKNPNLSYAQASKQVDINQIRKDAQEELSKMDALHNPDQNAGGDPTNVTGIGSSSANRSIGSQWGKGRSDALYQKIKDATKGMSREELENTRLNIKLNYTVKG